MDFHHKGTSRSVLISSAPYSVFGGIKGGNFGTSPNCSGVTIGNTVPGPGMYDIQPEQSKKGGFFGRGKTREVESENFEKHQRELPGPGQYQPKLPKRCRGAGLSKERRFNADDRERSKTPGPGTYLPCDSIGFQGNLGKFYKGERKSFTEAAMVEAQGDPGQYVIPSFVELGKSGAKISSSERKSYVDFLILSKQEIPGPGSYTIQEKKMAGGTISKSSAMSDTERKISNSSKIPPSWHYHSEKNSIAFRAGSVAASVAPMSGRHSAPLFRNSSRNSSAAPTPRSLDDLFRPRSVLRMFGISPARTAQMAQEQQVLQQELHEQQAQFYQQQQQQQQMSNSPMRNSYSSRFETLMEGDEEEDGSSSNNNNNNNNNNSNSPHSSRRFYDGGITLSQLEAQNNMWMQQMKSKYMGREAFTRMHIK